MTKLVGLGGDCQVCHQIIRFQPDAEKHFFDSVVSPIESVIALLEHGFDHILQEGHLHAHWEGDTLSRLTDLTYNIWHLHDIGRGDADDIARIRLKYAYLADKLMSLLHSCEKVIFVRRWHSVDASSGEAAARRLLAVLQQTSPASALLYLHDRPDCDPFVDGPFQSMYLRPHPTDWQGDNDAWDDIFAALACST